MFNLPPMCHTTYSKKRQKRKPTKKPQSTSCTARASVEEQQELLKVGGQGEKTFESLTEKPFHDETLKSKAQTVAGWMKLNVRKWLVEGYH